MTAVKLTLDQYNGVTVVSTGHTNSTVMPDGVLIDFDGVLSLNGVEIPSPLALRSGWVNRGVAAQARVAALAGSLAAAPNDVDAATRYGEAAGELDACERMIELFDRCAAGEFNLRDFGDVARNEPRRVMPSPGGELVDTARGETYGRVTSSLIAEAATTCAYEWGSW